MSHDPYHILGVAPSASQAELKAAHRRLVRRHHPDLVPAQERTEATRRVQDINVAYGLVRDPAARAAYDRVRAAQRTKAPSGATDDALARGLDELLVAAGRWAGRWWVRNRVSLRRTAVQAALAAGQAGRELVARVQWLVLSVVGALTGTFLALALAQGLGVTGLLTPVAGIVGGWAVGSSRGRRRRHRIARLPPPPPSWRPPVVAVLAVAAALVADGFLW